MDESQPDSYCLEFVVDRPRRDFSQGTGVAFSSGERENERHGGKGKPSNINIDCKRPLPCKQTIIR